MLNLILTIIQVVCGLAVIAVVMLQSGKSAGLSGAIAGGADTFLSKNKAKSVDAKLAKMTKWVAIVWIVLTLALASSDCPPTPRRPPGLFSYPKGTAAPASGGAPVFIYLVAVSRDCLMSHSFWDRST